MKKLIAIATMAAALLVRCQECPAQILGTNTSTGDVTLSNMSWQVAMTNASGNVPLLTTLYNFGPGGVEYGWGGTNAPHYLRPGTASDPAIINVGPVTPIMGTFWWRCASNAVTSVVRMVRGWQR